MKRSVHHRARLALLAASCAAAGGCYEHTVSAKGMGAEFSRSRVYEPNLKTTEEGGGLLDGTGDVLLGPRRNQPRRR
jgi:hypothetical protein